MKLTHAEVLSAGPALAQLSGMRLPVKASYRLARLLRILSETRQDYEKVRMQLIETHGKRGADDKLVQSEGNYQMQDSTAFTAAYEQLLSLEAVDVQLQPLSPDDLGTAEVPPAVLADLHWFITE